MQDNQDDAYAPRREELKAQFQALQSAGSSEYWQRIEEEDSAQRLPLEVLARCFRERHAAGVRGDAERIMNVIWRQVQPKVHQWSWQIANYSHSGMKPQFQEDLEQECLIKLWQELVEDDPAFLLENFTVGFLRLRQHVAQSVMEKAGEWQRRGVDNPTRIPRSAMDSLQAKSDNEGDFSLDEQLEDERAQAPFDRVDVSDLLEKVRSLPDDQRTVVLDRFWEGLTQEETAAKLGISTRMVRYLLKKALRELGVDYGGGEEGNRV